MQLSVIILNYNVRFFLEQCLLSVQKALEGIDAEIIVVDNASKDGSCNMVMELFPEVMLISNDDNLGFPKGNNIGVAQAKGEFICILNPDTVVAEDTFSKILDSYNSSANIGIIGCKLIDGTGNFLPESKRGLPTPWVAFTKIFGLYAFFPKLKYCNRYYAQHLSENQSGNVDVLVGAFMVMHRDLYIEVGGFDENCFMYSDDIDLSYMVLKKGKKNYYCSDTTVIHYKGESTVRDNKYVQRFSEAMQFFYQKHFGGSFVFQVFMRFGALLFSISKQKKQKNIVHKIDTILLFSKNTSFPSDLKYDFLCASLVEFDNSFKENIEIIFDTQSFSFKEIIAFMESNNAKNVFFKNYFPDSAFLIGSNHANDIGQVINLTKNTRIVR